MAAGESRIEDVHQVEGQVYDCLDELGELGQQIRPAVDHILDCFERQSASSEDRFWLAVSLFDLVDIVAGGGPPPSNARRLRLVPDP